MKTLLLLALTASITTSGLLACTAVTTDTIPPVSASGLLPVKKTMRAFGSEQELARYLRELARRERREAQKSVANDAAGPVALASEAAPSAKAEAESVTNTQHAGVDEGGIVKVHGDHPRRAASWTPLHGGDR